MTKLHAALTRAVRTAAQTALATLGTDTIGVTDMDWIGAASVAVSAAVLSLLHAIAWGVPEVDEEE